MAHTTTWEPMSGDGDGTLPENIYAFPRHKKEPLIDAMHVRTALERFHAVEEIDDEERHLAFKNLKKAAKHFNVEVVGDTYEEMCCRPQPEILPRD